MKTTIYPFTNLLVTALLAFVLGCADGGGTVSADAAPTPSDTFTGTDADGGGSGTDAGPLGFECAPDKVVGGKPATGDCVKSETIQVQGTSVTRTAVRANCTDPAITALSEKLHLILVPANATRKTLWLHLGGSGGEPTNTDNIGNAAALSGYHYISLAYPNEPSIGARCTCPEGPRPADCEGLIRYEVLYGNDLTPWFDMEADESILARLKALLVYLHGKRPADGWDEYLTADQKDIEWSRLALSGFSQGGGMAGLIARDHLVQRVMYLSKGAGATANAVVDPASAPACVAAEECSMGTCCPIADRNCTTPIPGSICLWEVPAPWASKGKDIDGDGLGDGDATTRATPGNRQFGLVHRDEGAWQYSPTVFEGWKLGTANSFVDADTNDPPYGGSHLLSTGLPPKGSCSEHQSMGADTCQPSRPDGLPAMWDAWIYAMTVVIE